MNLITKKITMGLVLALAIALAMGIPLVPAVHDIDVFELDRNATDESALGDDWNTVLLGGGGSSLTNTGLITDPVPDNSKFTGGGSKDDNDLNQWRFITGNPSPDKDNITHAFAAAYNVGGDLVIYFGLDRFANDGTAQVGFWFFKNTITASGGTFNGLHAVGDVLVQSNFTQGGVVSSVNVFEWVGSGGSHGSLDLISANGADCIPGSANDAGCATVNTGNTASPWPYTPKSGAVNVFPRGSFFEGGINITAIFGPDVCFSTFLAETRSSAPFNSVLKDFAGPRNFDTCGAISATKTCEDAVINEDGNGIVSTFSVSVTNDGISPITNVKLFESTNCTVNGAAADPNGNVIAPSLAAGGAADAEVICNSEGSSFTNVAQVKASSSLGTDDLTADVTAMCFVTPTGALTVTKTCKGVTLVAGGPLTAEVTVDVTVTNTGDEALENIQVIDNKINGALTFAGPLDPGDSHVFKNVTYQTSTQDSTTNTDPNLASFTDTIQSAQGTGVISNTVVQATPPLGTVTCFLCPPSVRP